MIIDMNNRPPWPADEGYQKYRVYLDGKQIRGVWYVDTDRGIVKTLD